MSGYHVIFHADTAIDYDDAYYWHEEQQMGLGEKFLAAITNRIHQIVITQEAFSVKSRSGYHEALVNTFPYTIVYRINKKKNEIFITSIHHQKKHPRTKYRK